MVPSSWGRAHVSKKSSCANAREPHTALCQEVVVAKAVEGHDRRGAESSRRLAFGKIVGLQHVWPYPGLQFGPGPWNLVVSVQTK